jgi:hypothetical protein
MKCGLTKNLYNLQHFSVREISVYLDGQQFGIKPLTVDFADRLYAKSYMSLFNGTGTDNRNEGNDICRTDYGQGFAL